MRPILLTLGEPAGIGPDCVLLAHARNPERFHDVVIAAPRDWLAPRAERLGLRPEIVEAQKPEPRDDALVCWWPRHLARPARAPECGRPSLELAPAVIAAIEEAAAACLDGRTRALVTGPIDKAVLRAAGLPFPGHTEWLAHRAGDVPFAMMLAAAEIRVVLLTTHLALREVPDRLSIEGCRTTLRLAHEALRDRFGIPRPHLALCALNPHAGEQGNFGDEEIRILRPAASQARAEGIHVEGPLPADTAFAPDNRKRFDAFVCCYHDQALIPIKALSFGEAVNITLGLPFVRTSVDHGTACDRAGTGRVSCTSLEAAIDLARSLSEKGRACSPA